MINRAVHIYISYIYNIDIYYVLQLSGCSSSIVVARRTLRGAVKGPLPCCIIFGRLRRRRRRRQRNIRCFVGILGPSAWVGDTAAFEHPDPDYSPSVQFKSVNGRGCNRFGGFYSLKSCSGRVSLAS